MDQYSNADCLFENAIIWSILLFLVPSFQMNNAELCKSTRSGNWLKIEHERWQDAAHRNLKFSFPLVSHYEHVVNY